MGMSSKAGAKPAGPAARKKPQEITVCVGLSCLAAGGAAPMAKGKNRRRYVTLTVSHCLGLCDKAPAMLVNGGEYVRGALPPKISGRKGK